MECFDHADRPAVGICIACGKGRCKECLVDLGRGLCCKGACEHEARRLLDLRDYSFAQPSLNESRMKWAAGAQFRGAVFTTILGVGFIVWAIIDPAFVWFWFMGGLFALFGIYSLIRSKLRTEPRQFRLCSNCGYNISRNTTNRCPECGHVA